MDILKRFDVISLGAALIDMIAHVERFPKGDDEVFVPRLDMSCGGAAANTAVACAKLGLKTAFIGKLGADDEFGKIIIESFEKTGVNTSLLKYSNKIGTGSCFVALNREGERQLYAHSGAADLLEEEEILENEIIQSRIIYLSSLKNIKPFVRTAKIAKDNDIPVILNPGMLIIEQGLQAIKPLLKLIDILIFSYKEFTSLLSIKEDELSLDEIMSNLKLLFELGIKAIVVTLGSKGSALFTINSTEKILVPPNEIEVIDTTGAGDAFSAGFIYSFSRNFSYNFDDLKVHLPIGNLVASKCIQQIGARNGLPSAEELNI